MLDPGAVAALLAARHADPFAVLGLHADAAGALWLRALLPGADTVDVLDAEHRRFTDLGLSPNPVKEFHRDGKLMAKFFFVQDPDGYKIEVLQKHGRYR